MPNWAQHFAKKEINCQFFSKDLKTMAKVAKFLANLVTLPVPLTWRCVKSCQSQQPPIHRGGNYRKTEHNRFFLFLPHPQNLGSSIVCSAAAAAVGSTRAEWGGMSAAWVSEPLTQNFDFYSSSARSSRSNTQLGSR